MASLFQSTHPVGGGTETVRPAERQDHISIHPPRGGWDCRAEPGCSTGQNFNPPTPWGVGPSRIPAATSTSYFNPPTPWGVGLLRYSSISNQAKFQSTHPVGGGTTGRCRSSSGHTNFNPPTPWGVGHGQTGRWSPTTSFQSTHPVGGGTAPVDPGKGIVPISIHPPRGGWDPAVCRLCALLGISIHPPRGGWDAPRRLSSPPSLHFNPPTPWGVGLEVIHSRGLPLDHFNPPTPWGVGHGINDRLAFQSLFQSTHPVGGGTAYFCTNTRAAAFQSTHPVGGGTLARNDRKRAELISIHPPRGGWDWASTPTMPCPAYFNPPTPWGVGLICSVEIPPRPIFQSTHPVGGGTGTNTLFCCVLRISIHPPRGGWDWYRIGAVTT